MPLKKTTPEEIIKKSILVFRTKGYYRTTMSDLALATNLTKGAFYHHFKNKEAVMKKSLEATFTWFQKKIFSIAYDEALTPKQRLTKMADILYKAFTKTEGGCFFANTILETVHVEDTFLQQLNAFFDAFEKALSNIFKEQLSDKELNDMLPQIIANIEGTIILMQLRKDNNLLRIALDKVISLIQHS